MFNESVLVNKNAQRIWQQILALNNFYKQIQSRFDDVFVESSYKEDRMRFEEGLESVWLARILSFLHVSILICKSERSNRYSNCSFDAEYVSDGNLRFVRFADLHGRAGWSALKWDPLNGCEVEPLQKKNKNEIIIFAPIG